MEIYSCKYYTKKEDLKVNHQPSTLGCYKKKSKLNLQETEKGIIDIIKDYYEPSKMKLGLQFHS